LSEGLLNRKPVQDWDVFYQKAILDDGSPFFPEKLPLVALETIRRTQGSYMFANQYMNQIIPEDEMRFKREWFRYYNEIPERKDTVIFIDPAIGQEDHHDFTGIVVVHGDCEKRWFVEIAKRLKLTPTQTVDIIFQLCEEFKPRLIGVEDVAYQKALIYLLNEEMEIRRKDGRLTNMLPVVGVKPPTDKTKEMKILSVLVPRMEYGRILFNQGLHDLEHELLTFPRGSHDDVLDALASCDELISYPMKEKPKDVRPNPNTSAYEAHYIKQLAKDRG
jgi:predicted phage terminase large subunit-like protein